MLRWPLPTFKGSPKIRASRVSGAPQYSFAGFPLAGLGITTLGVPVLRSGSAQYETLTANGAASLATPVTFVDNSTASDITITLADGVEGQEKFFIFQTRSSTGKARLTPANTAGFSTLTLHTAGAGVALRFTNGKWYIVGNMGEETFLSFDTTDETITGAGALSTSRKFTRLQTSSGTDVAITLAAMSGGNAIQEQYKKTIVMETKGGVGNYVLTVTSLLGYTTITFNTVGDAVILEWNQGLAKWVVVSNQGCTLA